VRDNDAEFSGDNRQSKALRNGENSHLPTYIHGCIPMAKHWNITA
jgi:hypothetical protein